MEKSVRSSADSIQWHEDWVSVVLGFLIIIVSLAWFVIPVPVYNWQTSDELFQKILARDNAIAIVIQFLFFYLFVGLGSFLTGRSLSNSLKMFPPV